MTQGKRGGKGQKESRRKERERKEWKKEEKRTKRKREKKNSARLCKWPLCWEAPSMLSQPTYNWNWVLILSLCWAQSSVTVQAWYLLRSFLSHVSCPGHVWQTMLSYSKASLSWIFLSGFQHAYCLFVCYILAPGSSGSVTCFSMVLRNAQCIATFCPKKIPG